MKLTYLCSNINYDVDDKVKKNKLPKQVSVVLDEVYDDPTLEEVLGDVISNSTGWCVNNFQYELVSNKA